MNACQYLPALFQTGSTNCSLYSSVLVLGQAPYCCTVSEEFTFLWRKVQLSVANLLATVTWLTSQIWVRLDYLASTTRAC